MTSALLLLNGFMHQRHWCLASGKRQEPADEDAKRDIGKAEEGGGESAAENMRWIWGISGIGYQRYHI